MSRFDKSGATVKLDANGNLDTAMLEKELTAALEFDVNYKQQDNMKKKAVKTSGTYDDFKAMVACSHLKTLTSKEVESLSTKKSGWQREYTPRNLDAANILMQEAKVTGIEDAKEMAKIKAGSSVAYKIPRNLLILERELCRGKLQNHRDRCDYLQYIGLKKLKALLRGEKDCTPELLENMLEVILDVVAMAETTKEKEEGSGEGDHLVHTVFDEKVKDCAGSDTNQQPKTVEAETDEDRNNQKRKPMDPFRWFRAVSSYERFHITLMFLPKPVLDGVNAFLAAYEVSSDGTEEAWVEAQRDLDDVRARFTKA